MKLHAVETTDRMGLCKINARNIKLFEDEDKAHRFAVRMALTHLGSKVRADINIIFDVALDGITKVYDKTDGSAEEAPALAFLTQIETE